MRGGSGSGLGVGVGDCDLLWICACASPVRLVLFSLLWAILDGQTSDGPKWCCI